MQKPDDEDGAQASAELPPGAQIFLLSEGVTVTTALSLAAELGIADHLAEGSRSSEDLARATSTHARSLYRVLRLLASVGVFTEVQPSHFALTPLGECLRTGVPGSMRSWLRMVGLKPWFHTFAEALHSVRTGMPAFERAVGTEFFDYLGKNQSEAEIFNEAMTDFGNAVVPAVAETYDFGAFGKVADIGGGQGSFITEILKRYPTVSGVLFDRPQAVESARPRIADSGLSERCEIVSGDFFQSVPEGADAYLLKWVIHDWDHDRAITILTNCRKVMSPAGRLLIVEAVIPPGDAPHPGKFVDFVMLTALGGQERTAEEYGNLLDEAGFRMSRVIPTASPMSVIEGLPK